jgi:probable HAF family extracellular repeat protein
MSPLLGLAGIMTHFLPTASPWATFTSPQPGLNHANDQKEENMRSRTLMCITAITLFAALATTIRLAAQQDQQQKKQFPRYTIVDLGTLGGTFSGAGGLNNRGWVAGTATLFGDNNQHEFLWVQGLRIDLGTLGGPNSGPSSNFSRPNGRGEVPGAAETSTLDPNGEDFCGFLTHLTCLPFIWQNGVMSPLPTLGGTNGAAGDINNRGQVAGYAENTTLDATCAAPQVLQFKPVVWEKGEVQELPTVSGDPDGVASAINDRGETVGYSGNCQVLVHGSPSHALLWRSGAVTDLGNLGGTSNFSLDINNHGQAVGASELPDTTMHAFLWQKGAMTDLGTLPGLTFYSQANGINDRGQVVGFSCDINFDCDAFLWQNGVMTDLNTLIPAGSPLIPFIAADINSRGQIVGSAFQLSTGDTHAFLATPSHGEADNEGATPAAQGETAERPKVTLPENVRTLLRQRLGFGRLMTGPW